jgi:transcriptional regulator with XRE-family HTH domain
MSQRELIVLKLIVLRLRESAGMTQAEMAKLLQVPLSTLTRWEAETLDREALDTETLEREALDREALDTETLDREAKKVFGLHAAGNKHKKG